MAGAKKGVRADLTNGSIIHGLVILALPIVGTQTLQMLYNLTDMFWLGRLGSDEVAATGAIGLYMWLSVAFMLLGSMGASIGVSQAIGSNNLEKARIHSQTALSINAVLGLIFALVMIIGYRQWVGFYHFAEENVRSLAEEYLLIVSCAIPFTFITAVIGAVFTAGGNSMIPFVINAVGAGLNMVLDPVFIFTFNGGVAGAAYATALGQIVVCFLLIYQYKQGKKRTFERIKMWVLPKWDDIKWLVNKTLPVCAESFFFTVLVMITSRREAFFGADAMAMSRVGSQIESLTWLVGGAFGTALVSFIGQNVGAGKWNRVNDTYKLATWVMLCYGMLVALLMTVPGKYIFGLFLPDTALMERSVTYLRILAVCQVPLCLEVVSSNTFRGIGETKPPAVVNTACNALRVPLAYFLSAGFMGIGLPGVWIAISICACVKGIWIFFWYRSSSRKRLCIG